MARKRRSRAFKESAKEKNVIDIDQVREERKEKRRELTEKKKKKQEKPAQAAPKRTARRVKRRLLYLAATLGMVSVVVGTMLSLMTLNAQQAEAQARLDAVINDKERLAEELIHVNTAEYVEQEARTQLRLIKPGEIMYIFPDEEEPEEQPQSRKTYIAPEVD